MGPFFKDAMPSSITNLFKEHCLAHLLQGFDSSKWYLTKPQGVWPSTNANWAAWVVRMETLFSKEWEALDIHDNIELSTMKIVMDKELLMAALSLWCSATNTMILPFISISPTILDISTILRTYLSGIPIDATLIGYPSNLDLKVLFDERAVETLSQEGQEPSKEEVQKLHKNFLNYNTLIFHFAGREEASLRNEEHEAFLFYWYNKFICCTKSNKCLVENMQWLKPWLVVTLWRSVQLSSPTFCTAWLKRPSTRSIHTRMDLSRYSNSSCRSIFPHFGQKSLTFSPLHRSAFSWLLNQHILTELKKYSNTFSA
ncbi:hypothetical protein EV2_028167 [Malus domestica]